MALFASRPHQAAEEPLTHGAQVWLQPPQLNTSFEMFVSHPFVTSLMQWAKPAAQLS
jgi:hypothetical protein